MNEVPLERIEEEARLGDLDALIASMEEYAIRVDTRLNDNEDTALGLAAAWGHFDMCKWLISARADVNTQDCAGSRPLHDAAYSMFDTVVKLLLEAGAVPNVLDCNGRTPLDDSLRALYEGVLNDDPEEDNVRETLYALLEAGCKWTLVEDVQVPDWLKIYEANMKWMRQARRDLVLKVYSLRMLRLSPLLNALPKEVVRIICSLTNAPRNQVDDRWRPNHVVLIGGGRCGIGAAVVRGLDQESVIWTSRQGGMGNFTLDMRDSASCLAFAKLLLAMVPSPRVIVFCGAVSLAGRDFCQENVRDVFETNYFGQMALAKLLIPLLDSRLTRFLFVSSKRAERSVFQTVSGSDEDIARQYVVESQNVPHFLALGYSPQAYMVSKMFLNNYVKSLSEKHPGLVSCCCPGRCKTALSGWEGEMSPEDGAKVIIEAIRHAPPPGKVFLADGIWRADPW